MNKSLNVFLNGILVGKLEIDKNIYLFQYSSQWLQTKTPYPLSASLPLSENKYAGEVVKAFFGNLLPEGNIRAYIEKHLQISKQNDFALLNEIGSDCAGAVALLPTDTPYLNHGSYKKINIDKIKEGLLKPSGNYLMKVLGEMRLSLAGAQDKLAVYLDQNSLYLPHGSFASSHILKPPNPHFEAIVENEYFCMKLAKYMALPVASVDIIESSLLLIKRYDRTEHSDTLVRLHQEDFCQAMGIPHERKYQSDGGPTFVQCFDAIYNLSSAPSRDAKSLLQWIIFNYVIGNNDAHAKNLSFLYEKDSIYLAPFYDLVSTEIYPDISANMAMKIANKKRYSQLAPRHWIRLIDSIQLKPTLLNSIIKKFEETLPHAISSAKADLAAHLKPSKIISSIIALAKQRMRELEKTQQID